MHQPKTMSTLSMTSLVLVVVLLVDLCCSVAPSVDALSSVERRNEMEHSQDFAHINDYLNKNCGGRFKPPPRFGKRSDEPETNAFYGPPMSSGVGDLLPLRSLRFCIRSLRSREPMTTTRQQPKSGESKSKLNLNNNNNGDNLRQAMRLLIRLFDIKNKLAEN